MDKHAEDQYNPIDDLTADMFRQIRCPKRDALTVFIPSEEKPPPEVQRYLDAVGSCRWYPQGAGYLVKLPNIFTAFDESLFKLEKNAWSHEHCDKCGGTIEANETCWRADTDEEYYYLFCDTCYRSLKVTG